MSDFSHPGPLVPSPFMSDLLRAFIRRRKAIKHNLRSFDIVLELDGDCGDEDPEMQLLRVEATTPERPSAQISLKIWEGGDTWYRLCRPGPRGQGGWAFNESFRGSTANLTGSDLVELFEKSLPAVHGSRDGDSLRERIKKAWGGCLS